MSSMLIESHFLPSLEYFCAVRPHQEIILEKHEHFNKQSFRNRCYLMTSQGVDRFTVPLTAKRGKVQITDVKIDYTTRWQAGFWRSIESSYAKAPYFEHYADELKREIFYNHIYLFDFNRQLLSICLQWLRWPKSISETVAYEHTLAPEVKDLRNMISAKKDYLTRELYRPRPYRQVFGNVFAPNLSVIDLVFCEGPHAADLINASSLNN